MGKLIFIIGLITLLADSAHAQGVADEKMSAKINELNKAGIDTIMVYGPNGGNVRTYLDNSPCYVYHNERYLVWIYKKHNYITLVDECYEYKVLKDKLKPISDLLMEHLAEIIKEDLKHPTIKTTENGKEELSKVITSDDAYYSLTFSVKRNSYIKNFGLADLTLEYFQNNRNIYYDQNQLTYLKQAYDIMNKALPMLKFKKK